MNLKDEIWLQKRTSSPNSSPSDPPRILVYLITGNPGLVEFYREFLTALSECLTEDDRVDTVDIVGHSLGGYELNRFEDETKLPLNLEKQVRHVQTSLERTVSRIRSDVPDDYDKHSHPLPVVLVGHSVGTYIILQLIAQRQKNQKLQYASADYQFIGCINLFPTVMEIASSPSGKKVSPFATSTYLAPVLHTISKGLCAVSPDWFLIYLIQRITGQSDGAAKVTAAFLGSKYGVLQALHMGRFELLEMTHDKWPDDVWNGPQHGDSNEHTKIDRPKMYFYWAENDHWIDNSTRDAVIGSRARRGNDPADEGKPHMEIDSNGMPHDFCINKESSRLVAKKTAGYIMEILSVLRS